MFTMIFACDTQGAIGKDGDLPWRQSSDLQHFKQVTMSKTIVMGRKTWDSLPKALPGRRNIVMSRSARDDVEVLDYEAILATKGFFEKQWMQKKYIVLSAATNLIVLAVYGWIFDKVAKALTNYENHRT
ncbi:MAG: dihydrofolate reductase, partial [Candidatus Poseidoniaceae archaeon]|nr:dihydrofolate reductase [Candidatus Poseidoniaceae archaeon]